jgi:signal transduction histidine kinase
MKMKNLGYILLTVLSLNGFVFGQDTSSTQIKILGVYVENQEIPRSQWNKIQVGIGESISFSIQDPKIIGQNVSYRVYLNGKLIDPEQTPVNGKFTFSNLEKGVYIFKIQAHTLSGWESNPIVMKFDVSDSADRNKTPAWIKFAAAHFYSPYMIYFLICLSVIEFILILRFAWKYKNSQSTKNEAENAHLQEEIADLKYSYNRLKEEIANQAGENSYLQKKIKDLEKNINNLENSNLNLLEQKERLAQSKRQLELLQNQKEELFAIAIHDIKNPAAAIKGYVELLNSYDLNANEQQEIMSSLMESSQDIVKLSQAMCTIIAQNKPEPSLNFTEGSIKKIIDKVCNQNMSYAKAKKVNLRNKAASNLPDVKFDEMKMTEVIDNLVNNAIKYAPIEKEIEVEIKSYVRNEFLVVEVKDNGVGLSEEDMKKAFQKGVTLTPKPTGIEQSSGLGLWLVKKITDEHNGKIWLKSRLDAGSTFAIEIPLNR